MKVMTRCREWIQPARAPTPLLVQDLFDGVVVSDYQLLQLGKPDYDVGSVITKSLDDKDNQGRPFDALGLKQAWHQRIVVLVNV